MVSIGELMGGMCFAELLETGKKAMKTPEVSEVMLGVWHLQLRHNDGTAIKHMMAVKSVIGVEKMDLQTTKRCAACIEVTMPNTALKSKKTLETRPRAVLDTGAAQISVIYVSDVSYFVTFINKASEHVSAFLMTPKAEAAELLKCRITWV